jgi:predicted kinase
MDQLIHSRQPALIVVTGPPGAGKTTLAHALAQAIRCPALCRDELKEGLVNTIGEKGDAGGELDRRALELFFQTVRILLTHGVTLVAEAAFQHRLWAPKLEPLREFARVRLIVCLPDLALARSRHLQRSQSEPERERYHHDRALQTTWETADHPALAYDPPHLDAPTLTVDTSDGYRPAFEEIVAFARG